MHACWRLSVCYLQNRRFASSRWHESNAACRIHHWKRHSYTLWRWFGRIADGGHNFLGFLFEIQTNQIIHHAPKSAKMTHNSLDITVQCLQKFIYCQNKALSSIKSVCLCRATSDLHFTTLDSLSDKQPALSQHLHFCHTDHLEVVLT